LDAPLDGVIWRKTIENLLAMVSQHIIQATFMAAGLTKLSPDVWSAIALAFFPSNSEEAHTALLWDQVFMPEVDEW